LFDHAEAKRCAVAEGKGHAEQYKVEQPYCPDEKTGDGHGENEHNCQDDAQGSAEDSREVREVPAGPHPRVTGDEPPTEIAAPRPRRHLPVDLEGNPKDLTAVGHGLAKEILGERRLVVPAAGVQQAIILLLEPSGQHGSCRGSDVVEKEE
jgi:hypothetical protein